MKNLKKLILTSFIVTPLLFGCGEDESDYKYIGPVAPFLHEMVFDDYTFDEDLLTVQDYTGSCSVVRNGNFVGRNFDYFFNNVPDFIVRMNAKEGRYASIGVAQTSLFKETDLLSNNYNKEYNKRNNLMCANFTFVLYCSYLQICNLIFETKIKHTKGCGSRKQTSGNTN